MFGNVASSNSVDSFSLVCVCVFVHQYLELNYETLLQDPTKFSPVAKFLDGNAATSQQTNVSSSLENSQPRSETLRLHPKTCAEKVSNWADLVRVLRKNGKEKYVFRTLWSNCCELFCKMLPLDVPPGVKSSNFTL